jgi:phosphatidylserine synthase
MDGAIARACNKKSWLGAFLDSLEDTLTVLIFGAFILWILSTKQIPSWIYWVLVGLWVFGVTAFTIYTIKTYNNDKFYEHPILQMLQDNSVFITLTIVTVVHYLRQ